jgi:hypothetical protein
MNGYGPEWPDDSTTDFPPALNFSWIDVTIYMGAERGHSSFVSEPLL